MILLFFVFFFFSSRRRHTRLQGDWSSDVCSSDLLRYVIAMTVIAGVGFAVVAVSSSYRMRRLTTFLNPWADPYNSGFQLTQSLIAIGRGQWFGVGLGESVQKLFYLPEAHTDFLFAVLAEELGLAGVVLTLLLFVALIWRSFQIARLASD